MKATVKEVFIDKYTKEQYKVGQSVSIEDADRVADLVSRNLIEVAETEAIKKSAKKKKGIKNGNTCEG